MGRLFLDSYYSYKKYLYCSQPFTNSKFKLHVFMGWYLCVLSLCDWKPFKKSCKFMIAYVIFSSIVKLSYAEKSLCILWIGRTALEFFIYVRVRSVKMFWSGPEKFEWLPQGTKLLLDAGAKYFFFHFLRFSSLKLKIRNLCKSFF